LTVALDLETLTKHLMALQFENTKLQERIEQLEWEMATIRREAFEEAATVCDAEASGLCQKASDMDPFHALTAESDAAVCAKMGRKIRESA